MYIFFNLLNLAMILKDSSKKWIAIYTKPKHEQSVAAALLQKTYEVYLPLLKKRRKWSDRKKWVEFPLFKSYLFVKTRLNNTIPISKTPGVVKIIKFGGKIALVDNQSIKSIKKMIDGGYNPEPTDYFITGDQVEVRDGPLKGMVGEVARIDNHDRLIIRIDSIQHSISVKINRGYLKRIK